MNIHSEIEIIEFSEELSEPIKILNYEWLQEFFRLEAGDVATLSNPKKYIIDRGGFIFYAKRNHEIVGTVSLVKKSETTFELAKMAVSKNVQGLGIGKILLEYCLNLAKEKNIETLVLYSNTKLKAAINLYEKYGFKEVDLEAGIYERANIKMMKRL
jgi:ribosomal protein S18 acetylase RimI-like enzyme